MGTWTIAVESKNADVLSAEGNKETWSFRVYKDTKGNYKVDAYCTDYTKATDKTETKSETALTGKFDMNNDKTRTFKFSTTTETEKADWELTEVNRSLTLSGASDMDYPAADAEKAKATLSFDKDHTEHSFSVMQHLGVNVIRNSANTVAALATEGHTHYLECSDCGLAYVPVTVAYDDSDSYKDDLCKACGAPNTASGDWTVLTISSNSKLTGGDVFIVKKGAKIVLPYDSYQAFGGASYDIKKDTGWTLTDITSGDGTYIVGTAATAGAEFIYVGWECYGMYGIQSMAFFSSYKF